MKPHVIVKTHEVALKGKNRAWFFDRLAENLRLATQDVGVRRVWQGQLLVGLALEDEARWPEVRRRVRDCFGVAKFYLAYQVEPDLDAIKGAIARLLRGRSFGSFRVTARRADKRFPVTSAEMNRTLGGYIKAMTGARVDLTGAELEVFVEVLPREAFVYFEEVQGYGGLPVGVSGTAAVMLSGGIDSPVASWYMMKRGCRALFVHFHSYPLVDMSSIEKATDLVQTLTRFQYRSRLFLVPFGDVQKHILVTIPPDHRVILYRRFMIRIAQALARREGAKALVTGESLGQVSSQTLDNIAVIDAVADMPVLRPLIGMNKEEIIRTAREIGTYETSILPDQDCCSLFVPRHPVTRADLGTVEELEAMLPVEELVERAMQAAQLKEYAFPQVVQPVG